MSGIIGLAGIGGKSGVVGPPPAFVVKFAGDGYDVNVTNIIYKFDTILEDHYGGFDNTDSNYKFTIPVAGVYQFNYSGRFSAAAGDWRAYELWIQANETTTIGEASIAFGETDDISGSNHPGMSMSTMYYMSAGDRVRVFHAGHRSSEQGLEASGTHQWFSGHWICP